MTTTRKIETHIRLAALFLIAGLAVEAASLVRVAALSFVLFTTVGLALFAIGAMIFLISLLEHAEPEARVEIGGPGARQPGG